MRMYHDAQRSLQDRFDSRRVAVRLDQTIVHDATTANEAAFITSRDFFFIATVDEQGQPQCSRATQRDSSE